MAERLITDTELARRLGCSVRTIQRLTKTDPDFPARVHIGAMTRRRELEADAYIRKCAAHAARSRAFAHEGRPTV